MSGKPNAPSGAAEWVDGFLFVGNQLALDFLNTKLLIDGELVELLSSPPAFERWLSAAGIASSQDRGRTLPGPRKPSDAEALLAAATGFREQLREAVLALEAGRPPSTGFLDRLNELLVEFPERLRLARKGGRLEIAPAAACGAAEAFWRAIAAASAALLTCPEPSRIRKCENCVLHFQDVSKKGSRRWCSMNLCGNKLKVAAYQQRRRASKLPPRDLRLANRRSPVSSSRTPADALHVPA